MLESATFSPETLKAQYLTKRQSLEKAWQHDLNATQFLRAHTSLLDEVVCALADAHGLAHTDCALLAIGGYGREELYPKSDIDLVIVTPNEDISPQHEAQYTAFIQSLWTLGLTVGASIRSEADFALDAQDDLTIVTSYLDQRFIYGNATRAHHALTAFLSTLDAKKFARAKLNERAMRLEKWGHTPFALEPNTKQSAGGLRDIHTIMWCFKALHFSNSWLHNFTQPTSLHFGLDELKMTGILKSRELNYIEKTWAFLQNIRIGTHILYQRSEDRLLFDIQESLAQQLGFHSTPVHRASEVLMKRYYLNAKWVTQITAIALQVIEEIVDPIGVKEPTGHNLSTDAAFKLYGNELFLASPDVYTQDPNAILRTFLHFEEHRELRLSTSLLRALWEASFSMNAKFRHDRKNRATFLAILKMRRGLWHALTLMNTWAILGRFLVPFRRIVGQLQHDLYHIYTVDQHTLEVINNLRRFTRSEYGHEFPLCSTLMMSLPRNWRLIIAALYHDIGKGLGGHHELLGAEKVRTFCQKFEVDAQDAEFIEFLVREHLTMSHTAQKRDITDPDVIRAFSEVVGTRERLDALYLLTVADIRATAPKLWTQWKADLLETLYRATLSFLEGQQLTAVDILARKKARVTELLDRSITQETRENFWAQLDLVYFLRHTENLIAWHTETLSADLTPQTTQVRMKRSTVLQGYWITLYTQDRQDLFSRAVAFIGRQGLSVVDARIYTTSHQYALDTFLVVDPNERWRDIEDFSTLETQLSKAIETDAPLPKPTLTNRLSRRSKHFPTRAKVTMTPDTTGKNYHISVVCTDRIGLLYAISRVLSQFELNLEAAKIATLDERAEDVFMVDSEKLHDPQVRQALTRALVEAIDPTA